MAEYFKDIPKIKYEGVNSTNPLSLSIITQMRL